MLAPTPGGSHSSDVNHCCRQKRTASGQPCGQLHGLLCRFTPKKKPATTLLASCAYCSAYLAVNLMAGVAYCRLARLNVQLNLSKSIKDVTTMIL